MLLELRVGSEQAVPHRFQLENRNTNSGYVVNYPTSIWVAQMSRSQDYGYRGQLPSCLTPSYHRLHPAKSYDHTSTLPTMGRDKLEQRLLDLRECIHLSVKFETIEPQKVPDKSLEVAGRLDHSPSYHVVGPSCPSSINVTQIDCEQNKEPMNLPSCSIPICAIQDGGNPESTRVPQPKKGPDKSFMP